MDKSSSLGMPISPQEISKKYKRQSLGCPEARLLHQQNARSSFKTLYFYCFVYYVFFLGRLYFLLSVFFCFVFCNKWLDPNIFILGKTHSVFIAKNTLVFNLIVQRVFSFSSIAFSFYFFALIFVQNLLVLCS
jgi:hypothetical protein